MLKSHIVSGLLQEPSNIKNQVDKLVSRQNPLEFGKQVEIEFMKFAIKNKSKPGPKPKKQCPWYDFVVIQKRICDFYFKFDANTKCSSRNSNAAFRMREKRDLLLHHHSLQQMAIEKDYNNNHNDEDIGIEEIVLPKMSRLMMENKGELVSEELTDADFEGFFDNTSDVSSGGSDINEDNETGLLDGVQDEIMISSITNQDEQSQNPTIVTNESLDDKLPTASSLLIPKKVPLLYKEYNISFDVEDFRWRNFRMASHEDLLPYQPRLQVKTPKILYDVMESTVGAYCAFNLREYYHAYITGSNERDSEMSLSNSMPMIQIPSKFPEFIMPGADVITIRKGNHDFNEIFLKIAVDLPVIVTSVIEFGEKSNKRDATSTTDTLPVYVMDRLEFGNCGQSWEPGEDGIHRPKKLVNTAVFGKIPVQKRQRLFASFANVFDALQDLMDLMHVQAGLPLPFNQSKRLKDYGMFNRKFLKAQRVRFEWDTVQVKNLTRGGFTKFHTDDSNCVFYGYDSTGCLYFYILDGYGELWSIKFLANSRGQIGSLYKAIYNKLKNILNRIRVRVEKIDYSYEEMFNTYTGPNKILPSDVPKHNSSNLLFLDPFFSWKDINIGNDNVILQKCMVVVSGIDRCSTWPVGAVTIIRKFKQKTQDMMWLLDLLILASMQSSFLRFYNIGEDLLLQNGDNNNLPESIGVEYYKLAMERFGMLDGGPHPRFVCSSINALPYYRPERSNEDIEKLQKIKERLIKLLGEEINNIPEDAPYEVIQAVIQSASLDILQIGAIQLGEFRLLVLIQIAILSGILVKPRPFLNNLMYPVKDRASYQHLVDENIDPKDFDFAMETICQEMKWTPSRNVAETCLCESLEGRREFIYDILFYGMNLYCLNEKGQTLEKLWNSRQWILVN